MDKDKYLRFSESFHRFLFKTFMQEDSLEQFSSCLKGITMFELRIIRYVSENPNHKISEILRFLEVPDSTLTSAINRLERKGILKRMLHNNDRRSYLLGLTEFGKIVHQEHCNADLLIAQKILDALDTDEEKESFIRLFDKISLDL